MTIILTSPKSLLLVGLFACAVPASAGVSSPQLFVENMVIQRETPALVLRLGECLFSTN